MKKTKNVKTEVITPVKKEVISPIGYDPFTLRQFKPEFKGTNLSQIDMGNFLDLINVKYQEFLNTKPDAKEKPALLLDSKWDFCKYLVFANPATEIKSPVMEISLALYPFIRSTYSARTPEELPILTRFVDLPAGFDLPVAKYVVCVLYSREQLLKEFTDKQVPNEEPLPVFYLPESVKYGIVAIMGTVNPEPDPLVPITILRNALGIEAGGNGEPINKEDYNKSVEFWNAHIIVSET